VVFETFLSIPDLIYLDFLNKKICKLLQEMPKITNLFTPKDMVRYLPINGHALVILLQFCGSERIFSYGSGFDVSFVSCFEFGSGMLSNGV
jgi:hypothetical protein